MILKSSFIIPDFIFSFTSQLELQVGGNLNAWALPFGYSWGQCDFNHAKCFTFQFLYLYITLMVFKKV